MSRAATTAVSHGRRVAAAPGGHVRVGNEVKDTGNTARNRRRRTVRNCGSRGEQYRKRPIRERAATATGSNAYAVGYLLNAVARRRSASIAPRLAGAAGVPNYCRFLRRVLSFSPPPPPLLLLLSSSSSSSFVRTASKNSFESRTQIPRRRGYREWDTTV